MDDVELAMGASPEIGRLYKEGKAFSEETPLLALSFFRGLAVACCEFLDRDFESSTLSEKIRNLDRQGMLKPQMRRLLKVLQLNGNKGAHPESYEFVTLDFPALAAEALGAARELIEHLYRLRDGIIPIYVTAPIQSGALKDMCVSAMLERDAQSMYLAGTYFFERADHETKIDVVLAADGYPLSAKSDIAQAMFLFKQAAEVDHPGACYRYGYYLTQHYNVSKDLLNEGEIYIARAAQQKCADALVYVGYASLKGSGIFLKNEEYAREVFEDAARLGHPAAWTQLGAMHALGVGGMANEISAARYTSEAAKAGVPQAQFNLFSMYIEGNGVEKDEAEGIRNLQEAAAQGHPAAIYNLATFIERGRVPDRGIKEAEEEYERAMQFADFRARSALYAAMLIERRSDEISNLTRAANHLQTCYSLIVNEDPHSLRKICLETCRKVVGRIRTHINANGVDGSLSEEVLFTLALFDKACIPVIDRNDRFRYLLGVVQKASNPSNLAAGSKFLLREACLEPRRSLPNIGRKSPATIQRMPRVVVESRFSPELTSASKVGRNDPCPCGSGKKFKKCHAA